LFEREHHRRVAQVLAALDAPWLAQQQCWFGGGTAIALRFGEFRESVDIDFLVSDLAGYRALRQRATTLAGLQALARPGHTLHALREVRADQYGIRTLLAVEGVPIKFEIVLEARIPLQTPSSTDAVCGVACLTPLDMAASKLLANSDRWADSSAFNRDVLDLALMHLPASTLAQALAKARNAYGHSIDTDLSKALRALLQGRPGWLAECLRSLQIQLPLAQVQAGLLALAQHAGLPL